MIRYEVLRTRLLNLQIKLRTRTGRDPLLGTNLDQNPIYSGAKGNSLPVFDDPGSNSGTPRAKPRSSKSKKSTFQSHVVESWEPQVGEREEEAAPVASKKASFKSHIPEGTLIDFDK